MILNNRIQKRNFLRIIKFAKKIEIRFLLNQNKNIPGFEMFQDKNFRI